MTDIAIQWYDNWGTFYGFELKIDSSSKNSSVIWNACEDFTITTDAENSTIKDFNNLKVGRISGELNEKISNNVHASIIGSSNLQTHRELEL